MKITKKNGTVVLFDDEKIARSVRRAAAEAGEELSESAALYLAGELFERLAQQSEHLTTGDIRKGVYALLKERQLSKTAEAYMNYKG